MKKNTMNKNMNTGYNAFAKKDTIVKAFTVSLFDGEGLAACVFSGPVECTFEDVCFEYDIPIENVVSYLEIPAIPYEKVLGLCEHLRKNLQRIA